MSDPWRDLRYGLRMLAASPLLYRRRRSLPQPRNLHRYWQHLGANPNAIGKSLRGECHPRHIDALDSNIPIFSSRSMPDQIDEPIFPVRSALWTYVCIGIAGLNLAARSGRGYRLLRNPAPP